MPLLGSDLCMSTNLELPICSCCHRHIMPNDKCVKFKCPNCDNGDLFWRCECCRISVRSYTCSSCNFQGP